MIPGRSRDGLPPVAAELSEDADVVRALYRAVAEGDDEALTRHADPGIAWVHPLVAHLPFDGTRRGLPAVLRAAFRRGSGATGPRLSPETFLEFGDGVLVVGRFVHDQEAPAGTGAPFLHECFVRGGRVGLIREYEARSGGDNDG